MRGQQQAHVHATARGADQSMLLLTSRDKIGGGDVDARFGAANGRQQRRVVARRQRATGLAAEDADHLSAGRARFATVGGERGTGSPLRLPLLIEQLLELTPHRSGLLKVAVVPATVRA